MIRKTSRIIVEYEDGTTETVEYPVYVREVAEQYKGEPLPTGTTICTTSWLREPKD